MSNNEIICRSFGGRETAFPVNAVVDGYHFTDAELNALRDNTDIRVLDLTESRVTNDGLAVLKSLPRLERLYLTSVSRITGAGLRLIAQCASLIELCILDTRVSDEDLQYLQQLKHLECVRIGSYQMTGSGLLLLRGHPSLKYLGLDIDFNTTSEQFANELKASNPGLTINW